MSSLPVDIDGVVKASELDDGGRRSRREGEWGRSLLEGSLCELSAKGASASLTFVFELIRESQGDGEPVAWVAAGESQFFPPDALRNGIDLEALPLVRLEEAQRAARAADKLVRSGGFGLVVVDLTDTDQQEPIPPPLQKRLVQHGERHEVAVVFLTEKHAEKPSLGALVSFRAHTDRRREGGDRFACQLEALADKRFGPGWRCEEVYRGPPGLR